MNKFTKSYSIFKNFDEFSDSEIPFNQIVSVLSIHYSKIVSSNMIVNRFGVNDEVKISNQTMDSKYISVQIYRLEHPPIQNCSHWVEFSVNIESGDLDYLNRYCDGIEDSLKFIETI